MTQKCVLPKFKVDQTTAAGKQAHLVVSGDKVNFSLLRRSLRRENYKFLHPADAASQAIPTS